MSGQKSSAKRRAAERTALAKEYDEKRKLGPSSISSPTEIPDDLELSAWRDTSSDPGTPEYYFTKQDHAHLIKTITAIIKFDDINMQDGNSESYNDDEALVDNRELQQLEEDVLDEISRLLPRIAAEGSVIEKTAKGKDMMIADWELMKILHDEFTILSTIRSKIINLRSNLSAKKLIDWLGQLEKDVTHLCFIRLTDLPLESQDDATERKEIHNQEIPERQRIGRIRGILVKALKIARESRVPGIRGTDTALEDIRKRLEGTALMESLGVGGIDP